MDLFVIASEAERYPPSANRVSKRNLTKEMDRRARIIFEILLKSYSKTPRSYFSSDGSIRRLRTAPSAGSRYPARISAWVKLADEVNHYFYDTDAEELVRCQPPNAVTVHHDALAIELGLSPSSSIEKYGSRGLLYAYTDVGHVLYNLLVASVRAIDGYVCSLKVEPDLGLDDANGRLRLARIAFSEEAASTLASVYNGPATKSVNGSKISRILDQHFDLIPLRRSAVSFSHKEVARSLADSACSSVSNMFHNGSIPVSCLPDIRLRVISHSANIDSAAITALCHGQEVARAASGMIVLTVSKDNPGIIISHPAVRLALEQCSAGAYAQALILELLADRVASTPVGAFDGEAIERLLGIEHHERICLILLYGRESSDTSTQKMDRS